MERQKKNTSKGQSSKPFVHSKSDHKSALQSGEFWKAKQLHEYRRANGLCYKCGDKFAHGHKCAAVAPQVTAVQMEEEREILSDEMLDMIMGGTTNEREEMHLSLNAISGAAGPNTIRVRALVKNQVLLMLLDSGSSHNFINESLAQKLGSHQTKIPCRQVKVANGDFISCDSEIPNFTWWVPNATFSHNMKVLPLGGYDAILGMDWLAKRGLMNCEFGEKWVEFQHEGKTIRLQGVRDSPIMDITEVSWEQLQKWDKGNEICATVMVSPPVQHQDTDLPEPVLRIIESNKDLFKKPSTLPPHRDFDHEIHLLPDSVPVNSRPYRYSPQQKDEIERQVDEMLKAGTVIRSMSPFASPVLLVKKKDRSWRFCVDYRKLNDITVKSKFPMPITEELLSKLSGAVWFAKLDLSSGFHQIRMAEKDEFKTAFKTHHGQYQFRVMPFGLTNAPSTFQCLMNSIFSPYLRKFILVFMDDILVYSKNIDKHVQHLELVFSILRVHSLLLKESKCFFAQKKLEYLGHIISAHGVATDATKTEAMLQWPTPTSVTALRGFLGLTGYYRRFVKGYGVLAKPPTALLQKKQFLWTSEAQQAFEALKQAMSNTPVLALPDFNKQFCIETDASDLGIGAVLAQDGHPIAYYSKALGINNQKLSIYEKEFLAIMMAVDRWRQYLQRGPFLIKTDHKSLCSLGDQQLTTNLQKKAMTKLLGLQFRFQYKKGVENEVADALSRIDHGHTNVAISCIQPLWVQEVINSYTVDTTAQDLLTQLAVTGSNPDGFSLHDGLIKHNGKI